MEDFLRERGVPESIIVKFRDDKIDGTCIKLMSDEQLEFYLPHYGDRLALRGFLSRLEASGSESKEPQRKKSLFERLRNKLKRSNDDRPPSNEKLAKTTPQAQNALKKCRLVGIGLMQYDVKKKCYLQVRTKSGGGTRNVSVPKLYAKDDIMREAKCIFFPEGKSAKFGAEASYTFDLMDYQFVQCNSTLTVEQMYEMTRLPNMRFYLAIRLRNDINVVNDVNGAGQSSMTASGIAAASSTAVHSKVTSRASSSSSLESATLTSTSSTPVTETVHHSLEKNDIPGHVEEDDDDSLFLSSPKPSNEGIENQQDFGFHMDTFDALSAYIDELESRPSIEHKIRIHRGHVFRELRNEFKKPYNLEKDIFNFEMVLPNGESEIAEDNGGVIRDALVEFWNYFYEECTMGRNVKVPFIRHDYSDDDWKSIASVLYLGGKTQNYFPISISKGFMAFCIFGVDTYSQHKYKLIEEFQSFLPASDAETLKAAMEGDFDQEELLNVLPSHDCRVVPTADNIKQLVGEIAHKELIQEPMYIKGCWWDKLASLNLDLGKYVLEDLYKNLVPNSNKVIKTLAFPDPMTRPQKATSTFLIKFVKELDSEYLARFLRFCTGSNLLLADITGTHRSIAVRFTKLEGVARRPVAHTCGLVLELPEQYDSYLEFRSEFNSVLRSDIWIMDFV